MLGQLGDLQQFLSNQTLHYQTITKKISQDMSYHINTSVVLTMLLIILFWAIGVRYTYQMILDEHLIIFEMNNILGANLRKQLDKSMYDN